MAVLTFTPSRLKSHLKTNIIFCFGGREDIGSSTVRVMWCCCWASAISFVVRQMTGWGFALGMEAGIHSIILKLVGVLGLLRTVA